MLQAWALAPKVRDERKIAEEFRIVWSNIHAKFLDKIHNIGGIFRHRVGTGRLEINWIANKLNFQVLPGMVSAWKLRIINFNIFRLHLVRSLWLTGPCTLLPTVQSCNNIAVSSSTEYELEVNYDGSTIEYFVDGAPANCGSGSNSLAYTSGLIGASTPVSSIRL